MTIFQTGAGGANPQAFYEILALLARDGPSADIVLEEESSIATGRLREALGKAGLRDQEAEVQVVLTGPALAEALVSHGYRSTDFDNSVNRLFDSLLLSEYDRETVLKRLRGG